MKRLIVDEVGPKKLKFIRIIRRIAGVSLKESVAIRNSLPGTLFDGITNNQAEKISSELRNIGSKVKLEDSNTSNVILIRFPRELNTR